MKINLHEFQFFKVSYIIYMYNVCVSHLFSFLCCPCLYVLSSVLCCPCLYVLSSVLCCPLRFRHKNDVLFVFTSSCLQESACLIYVICVCLRIMVCNVLFCFSSSCVPYVASFSGCLPFLITPSVFSNVYLPLFLLQIFIDNEHLHQGHGGGK